MQGKGLTWTCHICGQERPDAKISVQRNFRTVPGTNQKVQENVRYCNDKAECAAAAPKYSFMPSNRRSPVSSRQRRPVGQ